MTSIDNEKSNENNENKNTEGWAEFFTWIGFALVPIAMAMPFIVYHYDFSYLKELGAVGDFIGGTTVTFLTGASVFLLIATNIMQRKELQMSRKSIDEMVKQTEASVEQMKASVQQAKEAKKETQVTNETMKKQQFETTFFNMINLHHNILKELKYNSKIGREAIAEFYAELKGINMFDIYSEHKFAILEEGNIEEINELTKRFLIAEELDEYKNEFIEKHCSPRWDFEGEYTYDFKKFNDFQAVLDGGNDEEWHEIEAKVIGDFEKNTKNNRKSCIEVLQSNKLQWYSKKEQEIQIKHKYIAKFENEYYDETLISLKCSAYERLYKEHENIIGHYYRNLYRIVKLIQNNTFDNESEKRMYRGILRAQLSSFELLMLFYNISYSEKGKKFKELIAGINFFDDHLIEEDFIWTNDVKELAILNASKSATETNSI
ncbi:putative phage abortive infection protein [Bacillus sp. RC51]|uniref:putative phage abortive infection protein n=1 Tax=Bacillus sp. RC51 TaxID=3156288 RepID=UPI003833D37F